jgi:isopentenyl diphosphate isomerase/L-lactate dehydrogenase-like FMN-dependent dehydrogenase
MTPTPTGPKFVTLPEIRRAAREKLPRDHWNFGDGAAETESSKRRNRRHIDRLAIQQNVLVDAATSTCARRCSACRCRGRCRWRPWVASSCSIPRVTSRWRAEAARATRCSG